MNPHLASSAVSTSRSDNAEPVGLLVAVEAAKFPYEVNRFPDAPVGAQISCIKGPFLKPHHDIGGRVDD